MTSKKPAIQDFEIEILPEYAEFCERGQEGECGVTFAIWEAEDQNPDLPHFTHVKTKASGEIQFNADGWRGTLPANPDVKREAHVFDVSGKLNHVILTVRASKARWVKVKRKRPVLKQEKLWGVSEKKQEYWTARGNEQEKRGETLFTGTIDDVHARFPDYKPRKSPQGSGDVGERRLRFARAMEEVRK